MNIVESAKHLANIGFHVFPLRPNSKLPAIEDFPNRATRDPAQIERWFASRPYNIGISTTKFADDETLVVIDVDNKKEKKGDDELLKLELNGCEIPKTFEQVTPTGGRHLFYRHPIPLKQGVNVLGNGLDIRARGGYLVGVGSTLEGKFYTAKESEIAPAPEWLIEKLGESIKPKSTKGVVVEGVDFDAAKLRAIEYLEKLAPVSIEGQGGDQTAYKVAARVKDFGIDPLTCLELLLVHWNPRCAPQWEVGELGLKVDHAYTYGNQPQGAASPQADFTSVKETKEKNFLEKINDEYALVYVEGGHFVLHETIDEKGQKKRAFLNELTFKRRFSPKTVQHQGKGRQPTEAELWLDWPKRREYAGLCFAPEREPRHNYYNLWRGFTCAPITPELATSAQKQGLQMFLDHALNNVCHGDENLFTWLMGYFAHMIQRPYERPLTTLVFKGSKGTGKNTLLDRIGRLLGGSHYLVAHDGRYLTSNFNGHMDSCLMLVLDEAFWSGDKGAEGKLKGITTAPEIMIERKGKEPYVVDNLVRLAVLGNEDWLVPASHDERRYAVFQMGEKRKQDTEYFKLMRSLLDDAGGCGLLLHHLQHIDLTEVNVNVAPVTQALLEQKLESSGPLEQWWHECLRDGKIAQLEFSSEWPKEISKESIRDALRNYMKIRNMKTGWLPSDVALGRKLKTFCPSLDTNQKKKDHDGYVRVYRFPDLAQARSDWDKHMGHEVNWNE